MMDDEIQLEFLTESREGLDRLDADLVVLEEKPGDVETIGSIFRTIHTIKGTCGFFGYTNLERVAHVGESLLVKIRDGEISLTEDMTSSLLSMVDAIRALLESIETVGTDDGDFRSLVTELEMHARIGWISTEPASGSELEPAGETTSEPAPQSGSGATQPEVHSPATSVVDAIDDIPSEDSGAINVVVFSESDDEPPISEQVAADSLPVEADASEVTLSFENDPEMLQVIQEFLAESHEGLDRMAAELIELEVTPGDSSIISSIFRTIHTIKGTCGFFGFQRLEKLTHVGENLLVTMRDDGVAMREDIADALLALVDTVRGMLVLIDAQGDDGDDSHEALMDKLVQLREVSNAAQVTAGFSIQEQSGVHSSESAEAVEATCDSSSAPLPVAEEAAAKVAATPAASKAGKKTTGTESKKAQAEAKGNTTIAETSVRVDVPLLDSLMTQVGELVLARNQIIEHLNRYEDAPLHAAAQRLNLITSELQEGVMQTRMQPIHSIWAKLPRVVRDLSKSVNKKIRLEMEGKETELDKSLIEAMKDPLTHLVRNSVDHGVEDPATRIANGKPEEGVLLLRAYHESGQVHIEIKDDGAGINPEKIRDKAVARGLLSVEQTEQMTHSELCKLIFLPGLSTAEQVTNISGRGVGMDVVKTNIDAISGAIDLDSELGVGTTFKIRVPLTLAIVPALIVSSGSERFALPQANLLELIRVGRDQDRGSIEDVQGCKVYRLRGKLLPVVSLNEQLDFDSEERESFNMVVLQADQTRFGLIVDEINESQEIVVKPLAEAIRSIPLFAGATIMGDGRLALIIDVPGLARRAGVLSEQRRQLLEGSYREESESPTDSQSLLLVRVESGDRFAIPLSDVARLEQFNESDIEQAGMEQVVQYRGYIMPLTGLSHCIGSSVNYGITQTVDEEVKRVVVFGADGSQTGLIVGEILDVVEQSIKLNADGARRGVLGTAVIQGKVIEVFDASVLVNESSSSLAA